ncbi:hypothetical protein B0H14DRAFT_715160 [Mycena olivaceomarginata]|nr:hypothetical protein B0H14DRAFT_715160 [Mycena olivaceomarginata]
MQTNGRSVAALFESDRRISQRRGYPLLSLTFLIQICNKCAMKERAPQRTRPGDRSRPRMDLGSRGLISLSNPWESFPVSSHLSSISPSSCDHQQSAKPSQDQGNQAHGQEGDDEATGRPSDLSEGTGSQEAERQSRQPSAPVRQTANPQRNLGFHYMITSSGGNTSASAVENTWRPYLYGGTIQPLRSSDQRFFWGYYPASRDIPFVVPGFYGQLCGTFAEFLLLVGDSFES